MLNSSDNPRNMTPSSWGSNFSKVSDVLLGGNTSAFLGLVLAISSVIPVWGGILFLVLGLYSFAQAYKDYAALKNLAMTHDDGTPLTEEELDHARNLKKIQIYKNLFQGSIYLLIGIANLAMAPLGPIAPLGMSIFNLSLIAIIASSHNLVTTLYPETIPIKTPSVTNVSESINPHQSSFKKILDYVTQSILGASVDRQLNRLRSLAMLFAAIPVLGALVYGLSAVFFLYKAAEASWKIAPKESSLEDKKLFYYQQRLKQQEFLYTALSNTVFAVNNIYSIIQSLPIAFVFNIVLAGVFALGTAGTLYIERLNTQAETAQPENNASNSTKARTVLGHLKHTLAAAGQALKKDLSFSQIILGVSAAMPFSGAAIFLISAVSLLGQSFLSLFDTKKMTQLPNNLIFTGMALLGAAVNLLMIEQSILMAFAAQITSGISYMLSLKSFGVFTKNKNLGNAEKNLFERNQSIECVGCHKSLSEPEVRYINFNSHQPSQGPLCLGCAQNILKSLHESAEIAAVKLR
jgi:hypothetical protein